MVTWSLQTCKAQDWNYIISVLILPSCHASTRPPNVCSRHHPSRRQQQQQRQRQQRQRQRQRQPCPPPCDRACQAVAANDVANASSEAAIQNTGALLLCICAWTYCYRCDLRLAFIGSCTIMASTMSAEQREAMLEEKARKWQKLNSKRYSDKKKFGYIDSKQEDMPPEHLRKIVRDHGDMTSKKFRYFATLFLFVVSTPHHRVLGTTSESISAP